MAGKAVVEQFGLSTFTKADNAMRADKVTKQTADTFLAAAAFLELLQIWGALETEITQKIKFAKFHALRIVKAIKAGEDPNLSNPKPEPAPENIPPPLDPNDPEVQMLNGGTKERQPSVVDAPDDTDARQARLAVQSHLNESLHPSRAPSAPPANATSAGVSPMPKDAESFYGAPQNGVSPVSPDRRSSAGGNYFPRVPSPTSAQERPDFPAAPGEFVDSAPLDLPSAPLDVDGEPALPQAPTTFTQAQPTAPRTPLDSFQAPPSPGQPHITSIPRNLPQAPPQQPQVPRQTRQPDPYAPPVPTPSQPTVPTAYMPPPAASSQPAYVPASQSVTNSNVIIDEEAILKAQKHARWAISALNFEDVPTAVKEFQLALQTLGAR